jgi:hypothetical protein
MLHQIQIPLKSGAYILSWDKFGEAFYPEIFLNSGTYIVPGYFVLKANLVMRVLS